MKTSILIALLLVMTACKPKVDCNCLVSSAAYVIKYGTSFGFCVGYCRTTLNISGQSIIFNRSPNVANAQFPDKMCSDMLNESEKNTLSNNLQADIFSFQSLPAVIGCPDCADGGAEWIEITGDNGSKHKITFEFNKPPAEIANLYGSIKTIAQKFDTCK